MTATALHGPAGSNQKLGGVALAALGVVYGDIGTSPLYTLRECFGHGGRLPLEPATILGVLSLVFWSLILVVTLKYVIIMLRADNRGEGGILALAALILHAGVLSPRKRQMALLLTMVGAALFYGDSVITPAISMLGAVEGLKVAAPALERYVVPVAIAVLVALFLVQRRGTARVGAFFGPVMVLWFVVLGGLGLAQVVLHPDVLRAVLPGYAWGLIESHPTAAFVSLGAVVLAVTGAEALYADMGHFGAAPIRLAWLVLVLPALTLNYFGQGALLIADPGAIENPFYRLAPEWALYPMIVLATMATVIASQAVISGAFSLTQQAIQLGFLPRFRVCHTSESAMGQIYLPKVNWTLMMGVMAVVVGFGSSSNLAASYGIAVTGAMAIDTVLAFIVAVMLWRWNKLAAGLLFGLFLGIELSFFAANALKIPQGGWFPLLIAALLVALMTTWRRGRTALYNRFYDCAEPISKLIARLERNEISRIPGTAVFLTGNLDRVPRAMTQNLDHNRVVHERVVLLKVVAVDEPRIDEDKRLTVTHLRGNVHCVELRYGFVEQPNVPETLLSGNCEIEFDLEQTSFFLSRETLIPSIREDLSPWREKVFIALTATASGATEFFQLPPGRVVELGSQIEI